MATSSKKARVVRKQLSKGYENNAGYVRLRTILDSLEIGAIRFYLDDTSASEKKKRLEKLESELMPIIEQVWDRARLITCPRGYTSCDGACVPYTCP